MTLTTALRAPVDVTGGDLSDALTVIGRARTAATAIERADSVLATAAAKLLMAAGAMGELMRTSEIVRDEKLRHTLYEAEGNLLDAWREVENAMRYLEDDKCCR